MIDRTTPWRIAPLLAAVLLPGHESLPVSQQREAPTLRVSVSLVTVGVRVTGGKGHGVANLRESDFALFEDGKPQEIAFFANVETPLSLGILLDRSDSMRYADKLARAKTAARQLVDAIRGESDFLYVPFDDQFDPRTEFSPDRESTIRSIEATVPGGGTSLYDTAIHALSRCRQARHGRQALVVITDGADQHSSHTLDQLIAAAQESQAQLYTIAYFSPGEVEVFSSHGGKISLSGYLEIDNPRLVFKRLADETGAAAFFPRSDQDLQEAVTTVAADLQTQYTLAYYPSRAASDDSYHRITVKVRRPGLKVRARRGYRGRPSLPQ